jgi:hypothetical protein
MKIRPVGAELFHAVRQVDGDEAFRNAKATKKIRESMSPSVGEKARERLILAGVSQTVKINNGASQKVCLVSKDPPQLVRSPEPFSET